MAVHEAFESGVAACAVVVYNEGEHACHHDCEDRQWNSAEVGFPGWPSILGMDIFADARYLNRGVFLASEGSARFVVGRRWFDAVASIASFVDIGSETEAAT